MGEHEKKKGSAAGAATEKRAEDPFVRAANEDDDGYDPYSDRPDVTPLFEADPWD